jgi:predicted nucleic acid-binding protein
MAEAIADTSAMFYLHQIGAFGWLGELFDDVLVPTAVIDELAVGRERGHNVPDVAGFSWIHIVNPERLPSQWLSLDLGPGELAVLGLALEIPQRTVILDEALARTIAQSAGLKVWGTLRILLEAKERGLTPSIAPLLDRLKEAGMWISDELRTRVLALAGEARGSSE